jgi:hypothetical protein
VVVAPLKLGFIAVVTDSEFKAVKFARDLVADKFTCCIESMATGTMLFAIEARIAEQIPWLTTRTREGGCQSCAYGKPKQAGVDGKPKQERLIEGHLMRESFVWLLEHLYERVRLVTGI